LFQVLFFSFQVFFNLFRLFLLLVLNGLDVIYYETVMLVDLHACVGVILYAQIKLLVAAISSA